MSVNFKVSELIEFLQKENIHHEINFADIDDFDILGFSPISKTNPQTISWLHGSKENFKLKKIEPRVIIICGQTVNFSDLKLNLIKVKNPRMTFIKILNHFAREKTKNGIEKTAIIGDNCKIGENAYIGNFAEIGDNVNIGKNTQIFGHVTIHDNMVIGKDCIIHNGVIIGSDGFGFEKDIKGKPLKFPHIGKVIIGDNVEIKSYTCINKGTLTDTIIKDNVKIDDLCHIGHNTSIGKNTIIASGCSISGSVLIHNNVWISPRSVIKDSIRIGEKAFIGLGSVVIKNVKKGDIVAGVPAKSIKKN